jgi:hypothetical protein
MTLLALLVLVVVTARLATLTGFEAVHASRRACTLQHELAVDSAIRVSAAMLAEGTATYDAFAESGVMPVEFSLDECAVRCRIVNDAAKFNISAFDDEGEQRRLVRKLRALQRRLRLPDVTVKLRPTTPATLYPDEVPAYCGFDQLFGENAAGACFRWDWVDGTPASLVWSDVVTLYGDGRVDVRHARPEVLKVLLEDIDRSAANAFARARRKPDAFAKAMDAVVPAVRDRLQQRLTTKQNRYALTIETRVHGDRRLWYVVASMTQGTVRTVHFRGQLRW